MAKSGPIILIDDDSDDKQFLAEALKELNIPNKVINFGDTQKALDFLKTTRESPFIILSDVNMPRLNGIEFKRKIDSDPQLRSKSIPFVFFSTVADKQAVDIAYKEMTVQGFFQKPNTFPELIKIISIIMDYWKICWEPNT
jgi:CheY-like chemotaxis protein